MSRADTLRAASDSANGMKYVFVCGMPRSGTTILAKEIGRLENCTAFENTGVVMDEGQYLQDVYPTEWACGGAGRFGFDPRSHLTEHSPLLTAANVARLSQSWEPYWDRNKTIRIEKTPGNLLKTRFLQAAFPNAYFIVIKRHPVAVSLATQKWSRTPLHDLLKHWLKCWEIFDRDKKELKRVHELDYEMFIQAPKKCLSEIARFIGTDFGASLGEDVKGSYNEKYFARWNRMLQGSPLKSYFRCVAREFEPKFASRGVSLLSQATVSLGKATFAQRLIRPALYAGADIWSLFSQADLWLRIKIHRLVDDHCPPALRSLLQRARTTVKKEDAKHSVST